MQKVLVCFAGGFSKDPILSSKASEDSEWALTVLVYCIWITMKIFIHTVEELKKILYLTAAM